MRLVDADALKEQFTDGAYTVKGVREIIDNAPTISPYKAIHDELHKGEEE